MFKPKLTAIKCSVFLLMAIFASCKKNADSTATQQEVNTNSKENVDQTSAANTMVFRNRFQGSTQVTEISPTWKDDLIGNDGSSDPSDWTQILENSNPYFSEVFINYEQGTSSQRKASIIADPTPGAPSGNKVMKFQINQSHITLGTGERKGRIQIELNNKKTMPSGGYLREYRQKVRLYLHQDFNILVNSTFPTGPNEWLELFEFWNDPTWQAGDDESRIGVYLKKESNTSGPYLKFYLNNEKMKPSPQVNYPGILQTNFSVPIGKWMTVEIYIKEGDENTGKFEMYCTVDGVRHTIFNKVGVTKYPGSVGDGMTAWNPMKLYCGGTTADRFSQAGKSMIVYWDDLEIYTP